ncbi:nodulation protein NfeD [candidate division TA06 bacterium]|uniref:Nodulation protein NfeD n=1 Tax=candidate division TA06 bacterium TaxID=2250710 RepID=A0A933I9P8_UNCT6|nr:nodulation protein NfeD [candidate division TA06 bacterium]
MKKLLLLVLSIILVSGMTEASEVLVARVEDAVSPASARFMVQAIERAQVEKAECLIVEMDTPGGLDQSMRQVIKVIMASEVPVVVFVAPQGSRAASAGAFITMASHVAAMAPGTSIGAAHPVSIGAGGPMDSAMSGKVTNDAAAYIRSIAEKRGRNIAWADSAVRHSVSLSETEALKRRVIDLIAPNTSALLDSLDGRLVIIDQDTLTLSTMSARAITVEMNWRDKFLAVISNPNIAYVFFMLGLLGLYFEFSNPGAILPGVVGAISLILAFFAFQTLSVNYAGLLLILLSIVLFIVDVKAATHGVLTTGGIIAMFIGSVMLFNAPDPAMRASLQVIIPVVVVTAAFFIIGVWLSIRTLRTRPVSGDKGLLGQEGDARTKVNKDGGRVFVAGTHWSAWSETEIAEGTKIKVMEVKGMTLKVTISG